MSHLPSTGSPPYPSPSSPGTPPSQRYAGSNDEWVPCAYVSHTGQVEDIGGKRGRSLVDAHRKALDYARSLHQLERSTLRYTYVVGQYRWLAVRITLTPHSTPPMQALVEMRECAPPFSLTVRELDVLTLLSAGLSNTEIAGRIHISARTVAKHVENIFEKISVQNRALATGQALEMGLIRLPTPGGAMNSQLMTCAIERTAFDPASPKPVKAQARPAPIRIGLPLSFSGKGRADASEMLNGALLAVEEINERGGVLGRELELLAVDYDIESPSSIAQTYSYIINQEVEAISAGYSCMGSSILAMVGDFGAPYLHSATMDSVVNEVRNSLSRLGNIFQVCASDVKYGPGFARFITWLEENGAWTPHSRQIAVIMTDWSGLDIDLAGAEEILRKKRWRIDLVPVNTSEDVDWSAILAKVHRMNPSVVVLASYLVENGIAFQRAFMDNPLPALVYMLYNPSVPAFCEELQEEADGVLWATTSGLYTDRLGERFMDTYRNRFGAPPGQSHAGLAYDRVHILANSWLRTGTTRRFDKIIHDLRNAVHRGVNGAYHFGTDGQVGLAFPDDTRDPSISKAHLIFQIQQGIHRTLLPEPYTNGEFTLPPWLPAKGARL